MAVFSIYSETTEHREPNERGISEHPSIGEAEIHFMEDGRAFFVSSQATNETLVGLYIECIGKSEAQDLASLGVIVFDGDKIFDSMTDQEKNLFNACVRQGCYVDNPVIEKIASALIFQNSCGDKPLDLPVKYYCPIFPVLLPNEMAFLKTAKSPKLNITINTNRNEINYR